VETGETDDLARLWHFFNFQKLVLFGIRKFGGGPLRRSGLKYLRLELTTFNDFKLAENLIFSLEELYISHHGISRIFVDTLLELPHLRTLGITPYELDPFQSTNLPALQKMIFNAPLSPPSLDLEHCIEHAVAIFGSIKIIELYQWDWETPSWNVTNMVEKLLPRLPSLVTINFVRCFVDGTNLIKILSE
jgi:hypothetical protein